MEGGDEKMRKKLIAGAIAGGALLISVMPVFAAKPDNPGCVGEAVSGQAHSWGGRGGVVSAIARTGTYGDGVKAYLAGNPCGLNPGP